MTGFPPGAHRSQRLQALLHDAHTHMHVDSVYELPPFDSGQYEGSEFRMTKGNASLHVRVAELGTLVVHFHRVRWHQFTALPNCSAELVRAAYFRLVEVSSPQVQAFVAADAASAKAYSELHHYRIFLGETGCHELFAQSFTVAKVDRPSEGRQGSTDAA
jgi:hypothetical protein